MLKATTTLKHRVATPEYGDENIRHYKPETSSMISKGMGKPIHNATKQTDASYDSTEKIGSAASTLQFQDVCSAAFRINDAILKSPCEKSGLSDLSGCELYFKKEFLQATGSFKIRSARHILMLLSDQQRAAGVVTASSGNFALSIAHQSQQIGIPLTIVMPLSTNIMKIQNCKNYGADVVVWGGNLKKAKEYAVRLSKEKGFHFIDSFDHPLAITAAGTIGLEIMEQMPDVDAVIVPVGSGVLIAGISLAIKTLKPSVEIIGVESESCPNLSLALEAGRPITIHPESSIADELAVTHVGRLAFNICAPLVNKVIVTKEDSIALAVLRMAEKEKTLIEGSGACGLAALLSGQLGDLSGKKVVVCLTEANMNTTSYARCLERGLAVDGRLLKVTVTVGNQPGAITELVESISKLGIIINNLWQHKDWIKADIYSATVDIICESRDKHHALMLEKELRNHYSQMSVLSNFEMDKMDA